MIANSKFKVLAFTILLILFFGAITYKIILVSNGPLHEFDAHINFAVQMSEEMRIVLPHFLFQSLTIFHHNLLSYFDLPTYQVTGVNETITYDWGFSAIIVMLEIYVGIGLLLAYYFKLKFHNQKNGENLAYFVAFGLLIAAPLFLLAPVDGLFYLGYITPSTIYIIPTQILLKLPSLALFLLTPLYFAKSKRGFRFEMQFLLAITILVILSVLAKPNWMLVMMPALLVVSIVSFISKKYVNWPALFLTMVSCTAILGWQYYFKFIDAATPAYKSTIIITKPFEVWRYFSNFLFIKIVLSIAFPLYVTIVFWKTARNDFSLMYGWLIFFIGLLYAGFFGESEPWTLAGNFIWCSYIACFMLFVSTASFFFEKYHVEAGPRKTIIGGRFLFLAHIFCGLIYYFRSFYYSYH